MKSGLGTGPAMRLLLLILAQIATQMRTWYNDNMAITFFLSYIFCWKVSYFAPLGESSQELALHQNNSIGKSIKLIRDAREVQGPPCCILLWMGCFFFKWLWYTGHLRVLRTIRTHYTSPRGAFAWLARYPGQGGYCHLWHCRTHSAKTVVECWHKKLQQRIQHKIWQVKA